MKSSNSHKKPEQAFLSPDGGDGKNPPTALDARFAEARSKLNPRRQHLVRAILDSADETCFLSSREMAKRYHVDATTILRTTQVLGYGSFADGLKLLRDDYAVEGAFGYADIREDPDGGARRGFGKSASTRPGSG